MKALASVSVNVGGQEHREFIDKETYEILCDALLGKSLDPFLCEVVEKYGKLTEENILKMMQHRWGF